jgi:hypothetical protein
MTAYMEAPQQKAQLLNWVLQLLAQYRASNLWQVRLAEQILSMPATAAASAWLLACSAAGR